MAQAVSNLCVSRKVSIKHQVNWNIVSGEVKDLHWRNIWSADDPRQVLNEHLSLLVRYVPTTVHSVHSEPYQPRFAMYQPTGISLV